MFGNIKHRLLTELRLWWRYKYRIFCGFIAFVLAFCCYNYVLNRKTASADVSLNYLEASSGLNPNNTKYNVYEVFSDEILENAIKMDTTSAPTASLFLPAKYNALTDAKDAAVCPEGKE